MNNVAENKNEKAKETKKTSKENSYEDYENEEMEGAQESFGLEEEFPETDMPSYTDNTTGSFSIFEGEVHLKKDSCEERNRAILREKWLTVTGRKPRNIPIVKRLAAQDTVQKIYFGDRRPAEVEIKMRQKFLLAAHKNKPLVPNLGTVQREIRVPALCDGVLCIRFGSNAEVLTTAYRNGGVEVRTALGKPSEVVYSLKTIEEVDKLAVRALRYHPFESQKLYIGGATGIIQVFDINSTECIKANYCGVTPINSLDITSNGDNVVAAGQNGNVSILDAVTLELKSFKQLPELEETTQPSVEDEYHKMRINALKCHPKDPNIFVTGSWDGTVKVWDVRGRGAIKSIRGPMIFGEGVDLMEEQIVTASWRAENSLNLWDLPSGKLIKDIPIILKNTSFEGEFLYTVKFFSDDTNVDSFNKQYVAVGGSGFGSALVINMKTGAAVASFPAYKAISCLDVQKNLVTYGGKESILRIGEVIITQTKGKKAR